MSRYRLNLAEARTYKSSILRFAREMDRILKDKALPASLRKEFESFRASLRKTWAELEKEAVQDGGRKAIASQKEADVAKTKTVGGKSFPASDFLVTEDPESPSTWHLQVKRNGKPDPRLMGAAHAALMSPNGFRGNKYAGPDKQKAVAALKKMYADMDMTWPENEEAAQVWADAETLEEGDWYGYDAIPYVPGSVISFAQLEAAQAAQEVACNLRETVNQFQQMINNIFWSSDETVPDKIGAVTALFDEFIGKVGEILSGSGEDDAMAGGESGAPAPESQLAPVPAAPPLIEGEPDQLAESQESVVTLVEEEAATNPRGPLEMDVQLIQPGWGNSRDNHYYPREMLARDAHVFESAKMYLTDHRAEEKSVRTEAGQIKRITGFTEGGAPVARVVIFDPDFAEATRNRAKAGVLGSLECSILADGKARAGFEEGGRKGKVVEAITSVSSVDWVTRAGAGGKALALAEAAAGEPAAENEANPAVPVVENDPAEKVAIREEQQPEETAETAPEEAPAAEAAPVEPPAPACLGEVEIQGALARTNLPAASVLSLAFGKYETQEKLNEAIQGEVKRIKEISGSGKPFALGESAAPVMQPASREKIEEVMDKVNSRFGIGR